jgi:hypothetical protein
MQVPVEEWKSIKKRVTSSSSEYLQHLMFELSKYRV